jgi:hypothetical protein
MGLPTAGTLSFSQINECVRFTNGNVGINTTSPTSALDVNGDIQATGITVSNINITGNIYQNGSTYQGSQWTTTSGNVSYTSGSVVATNLVSTSATTSSLLATTGITAGAVVATNLTATNITSTNIRVNQGVTTGSLKVLNTATLLTAYITDLTTTRIDSYSGQCTFGSMVTIGGVTVGSSLYAITGITTGTFKANGLSTLATISATDATAATLNATTGITTGTLYASTGITTASIAATTITGGNLSLSGNLNIAGTLTAVNVTTTNLIDTNISTGTITVSGLSSLANVTATNATAAVLIATTGITTGTVKASGTITGATQGFALIFGGDSGSAIQSLGSSYRDVGVYSYGGKGITVAQNSGNVGIGATSPSFNLHIGSGSGTIGFDTGSIGSLRFTGAGTTSFYPGHTLAMDSNNVVGGSFIVQSNMTQGSTKVGINNQSPSTALHVNGSITGVTQGYALLFGGGGGSAISGVGTNYRDISIASWGGNGIVIAQNNGYVGIGTGSPSYPLHVTNTNYGGGFNYFYLTSGGTGSSVNSGGFYSIMASGRIGASEFNAISDERVKENIVDVNDQSALSILRQIQPKRYNYVDKVQRGETPVWGFIAQQVASVLDYATRRVTDFIPSIYELGNVANDNHTITLQNKSTTDFAVGTKIKLISQDSAKETTVTSVIDNKNFTVEIDLEDIKHDGQIFVYGVQVDDFHTLNKDAIFTIATAALQEVDSELQAEKAKVARLEAFIQSKFPGEFTA